ncbi:MAG: RDD family protein [Nitrospirae bacterium]|nr:RDD family protein [Candidatus Manganitrophaceae bacterium]
MEIINPPSDRSKSAADPAYARHSDAINETRPAGFIRRAIAYSIDLGIIFILFLVFIYWGAMGMQSSGSIDLILLSSTGNLLLLSFVFLYSGYFSFFHAYGGQTPAKMVLRIIVVDKDGLPPSHLRALTRSLGLSLSHLFFGLGFLLAIIEPKKRALHDLLTGTQVILAP